MAHIRTLQRQHKLPSGLQYHCDTCDVVIPTDAPAPGNGACGEIMAAKLTWYSPTAPLADQHVMATAAWSLLHYIHLRESHAECTAYLAAHRADRKAHFTASAARAAMSDEAVDLAAQHHRLGWLYR